MVSSESKTASRSARRTRRLLLLSASMIAMMDARDAFAANPNPAGSTTSSIDIGGAAVGSIINAGTITPGEPVNFLGSTPAQIGIYLHGGSTVTGTFTNSGAITVSSANAYRVFGIATDNSVSTIGGGFTNTGAILATNTNTNGADSPSAQGIYLGRASLVGGFTNNGTIIAGSSGVSKSAATGVRAKSTLYLAGGFTNAGTIQASGAVNQQGVYLAIHTFAGDFTNSGVISAGGNGVFFSGATGAGAVQHSINASITGNVLNAGTIISSGTGGVGLGLGVYINSTKAFVPGALKSLGGAVVNQSTGLIQAASTATRQAVGVQIDASTFAGGITNAGTIIANAAGNTAYGISVQRASGGVITNSGTILATGGTVGAGIGINVFNIYGGGATLSGVTNSGLIAVTSTATRIRTNAVSGIIAPGYATALRIVNATVGGGITNLGTISSTLTGAVSSVNSNSAGGIGFLVSNHTRNGTAQAGSLGGNISNAGLIAVSTNGNDGVGILVEAISPATSGATATVNGGITNTGTIFATGNVNGVGITVNGTSLGGAISNSGTIVTQSDGRGNGEGIAIDLTEATNAITINQSTGLMVGDLLLSPNGDTVNISGGVVEGSIVPVAAGTGIVNLTGGLLSLGPIGNTAAFQSVLNLGTFNLTNAGTLALGVQNNGGFGRVLASNVNISTVGTQLQIIPIPGSIFGTSPVVFANVIEAEGAGNSLLINGSPITVSNLGSLSVIVPGNTILFTVAASLDPNDNGIDITL